MQYEALAAQENARRKSTRVRTKREAQGDVDTRNFKHNLASGTRQVRHESM